MSLYTDNKETLNSIFDSFREGVECDDQKLIMDTLASIPESFWKDRESSTKIMEQFLGWVGSDFFIYPIDFLPEKFWEEEMNVWSYVVTLCDFYDDERIDYNLTELIPVNLLMDKKILKLLLYYNYFETISYIPDEYKTDTEILFEALDGLQRQIEYRKNTCSSWRLPFDQRECFDNFLSEMPETLSSDKDFVMGVLEYDYFSDEFEVLYDWVDEKFWADKEVVQEFLKADEETPLTRISKDLFADAEFMNFLAEIFDVYELACEYLDDGDTERGIPCMIYAANEDEVDAQASLAEMYYKGNGVEKDFAEALKWYKMAAENGDSEAIYFLGHLYYRGGAYGGMEVEQDYQEAYYWFEKDSFRYLPDYICADMYFYVDQDYKNAFRLYCAALEQGVEDAAYQIGEMYYYGLGVEQDYGKAFEMLKYYNGDFDEEDVEFAPPKVHHLLGEMYKNGWGVEQNLKEAEKLFRAAQAVGNP